MAKQVVKIIKLLIPAGKANPAPPIGPALGGAGVNIMAFCKEFNAKTQALIGINLPTVITVYKDKSFTFITKQPPNSDQIKKKIGITKGSGTPHSLKVGQITRSQAREIAKEKMQDMNTTDLEKATNTILGSARSMGVEEKPE